MKAIIYELRGQTKRGVEVYSERHESGLAAQPWLTHAQCLADAIRRGREPLFQLAKAR